MTDVEAPMAVEEQPKPKRSLTKLFLAAVIAFVVLVGASVTVVVVVLSRSEPKLAWQPVTVANLPAGAMISAASCPAADECWLVGVSDSDEGFLAHVKNGEALIDRSLEGQHPSSVACRDTDDCWVGSNGYSMDKVWHYDGRNWSALTYHGDEESGEAAAVQGSFRCNPDGACVAYSGPSACQESPGVWDGSSWKRTGASKAGCLRSVACAKADACDGFGVTDGSPTTFRLDDGAWPMTNRSSSRKYRGSAVVPSCPGAHQCLVLYTGALLQFSPVADLARLDGDTWTDSATMNQGLPDPIMAMDLTCVSLTDCVLVGAVPPAGSARAFDGDYAPLVAQWDGATWTTAALPSVPSQTTVFAVSCGSKRSCWAFATTGDDRTVVLHGTPA